MENVKNWHQSSGRVESIWNWKQMTMPFWEPIPYTDQLMHCKKLRAQKPTENTLKPINSKYHLLKEFFKACVHFYTCSHLCCDVLFSFSFSRVCAHMHTSMLFVKVCSLSTLHKSPCFFYISFFTSFKEENYIFLSFPEAWRLRNSDTRQRFKVSPINDLFALE